MFVAATDVIRNNIAVMLRNYRDISADTRTVPSFVHTISTAVMPISKIVIVLIGVTIICTRLSKIRYYHKRWYNLLYLKL